MLPFFHFDPYWFVPAGWQLYWKSSGNCHAKRVKPLSTVNAKGCPDKTSPMTTIELFVQKNRTDS